MSKKLLFLFWLCLASAFASEVKAQERIVSGKVTSQEDGTALPGVNVVLKGTTTGTVTDSNGNYRFSIPTSGGSLVFSFIGLQTTEIPIGDRSVIDVGLSLDVTQLGEVVVTAAGIERQTKALGYSVENVGGDKVSQRSEPDLLRSLQGKVAGVNIASSSGLPGSSTRITIRGNSSLFGNNQPLFVVDGIPFDNSFNATSNQLTGGTQYGSRIADLDPNNIESMTVLKGGPAAALYGVRAANGVIVITTKSGASKSSRKGLEITYSAGFALEQISNLPDFQNKYGTGSRGNYAEANGSWGPAFDRDGPGVNYNSNGTFTPNGGEVDSIPYWSSYKAVFPNGPDMVPYQAYPNNVSDFFEIGKVLDNSISVTGGNDKSVLTAVLSRTKNEGFVPGSEFTRNNISLGGNTTLANGFHVGGNLSYINSLQKSPLLGSGGGSVLARTIYPGRNWDITGQPKENPNTLGNVFFLGAAADNPYWSAKNSGYESLVERMISSFNIGYDVNDWLSFNYKIGINTYNEARQEFIRKGSVSASGIGQLIEDNIFFKEIESNFLASISKEINSDLRLKATLGHNINERTNNRQSVLASNQVVFDIIDIDNFNSVVPNGGTYSQRRLMGVFADLTLDWKDYLFLNVTGRNDWSSTLPVEQRSFFYPAVSSSFVFTEAFGLTSKVLTSGKLRAGLSKVGNDAPIYSLNPTYAVNPVSLAYAGGVYIQDTPFLGQPGTTISGGALYDPKLTPEFTSEFEVGADLGFWNDRVSLSATMYNKRTTDQIAPVGLPGESGYNTLLTNFGEISNKGVEIGLNIVPVSLNNGFKWEIYTAFTRNRNIVEKLRDGVDELILRNLFTGSVTPKLIPGKPYGVLMGTYNLKDDNGNFLIDPATGLLIESTDLKQIGDPNPDFVMGVTNTFRFKGLSLSAVIDYKHGGDLYSNTNTFLLGRGVTTDTQDREGTFIVPGVYGDTNTQQPILDNDGQPIVNTTQVMKNDLYFQTSGGSFAINGSDEVSIWDATVVRLREVALGFDLPKSLLQKTPFGNVSISLTGRNLWYKAPNFPKGSNYDPEANSFGASNVQGIEYTTVPSVKRYGFNLRVTF